MNDNLLLTGQMPTVTDLITVAANQKLKTGTVLGLNLTTEEAYPVDSTKTDGTETPYAVLAEDVTTSAAAGTAVVYLMAELNADALIVGSGTVDNYHYDMRKIGLIVRDVQNRGI